eukprot:TRINITY_DN3832_c0_g1_i1.p1 TRINITY_DN3832_c0_g1~~TRINITY_DN3832_c0_g1_i1.p1  ORF type:complete len:1072 (-),score=266.65 TRINITY_DN3832_c0_g1_i1:67-3249(-)
MKITILFIITIISLSISQAMVELATTKSGRNYIIVGGDQQHLSAAEKRSVYLSESDHHVTLGYDTELDSDVFVFDSHEDQILEVQCTSNTLIVTARDPSVFDSWKEEETILIGGLQWDCSDEEGDLAPFYRALMQMKRLSENVMYVETEETSFLAAFKKMEFEYDFRPVPVEEREDLKKRSVVLDSVEKRATYGGSKSVELSVSDSASKTLGEGSVSSTISASYEVKGGCYAKIKINVRWWRLRVRLSYAEFAVYSSFNAAFDASVDLSKSYSASKELFSKSFSTKVFYIGVVPVVVKPGLVFTGYLDANAAVSLSTGFTYDRYYKAGVKYSNGRWSTFKINSGNGFQYNAPALNEATADLTISLGIKPQATIYGIFVLSMEALPYITASLDGASDDCANGIYFGLYYGVDLEIGFEIKRFRIFRKTIISGYYKSWRTSIISEREATCPFCGSCIAAVSDSKRQIGDPFAPVTLTSGDNVYWRVGEWEECSKSCGVGEASRSVKCIVGDTVATWDDCRYLPRPQSTRLCNTQECDPCASKSCTDCIALSSCNWCSTTDSCLDIDTALATCNESLTTEPELCKAFTQIEITSPEPESLWSVSGSNFLCIEFTPNDPNMTIVIQMKESASEEDETWYGHGLPLFSKAVSPICFYPMGLATGEYNIYIGDMENDNNVAMVGNVTIDSSTNLPGVRGLRLTPFDGCSVECGGGVSVRTATCYDDFGDEIDIQLCGYVPHLEEKCNEFECQFDELSLTTGFKKFYDINETFPVGEEVNISWTGGVIGGHVKLTLFYYGFDSLESFRGEDRVELNAIYNPKVAAIVEPLIVYIGENTGSFIWTVPNMSPSHRYVMEIESTDINGESLGFVVNRAYFPIGGQADFYVGWTEVNTPFVGKTNITLVNLHGDHFPLTLEHNGNKAVADSVYFFNGDVVIESPGEIIAVLPNDHLESVLIVSNIDKYVRTFSLIDPTANITDCFALPSCEICGRVEQCGWCAASSICMPVGKNGDPSALIPCPSGWSTDGCLPRICSAENSTSGIVDTCDQSHSGILSLMIFVLLSVAMI